MVSIAGCSMTTEREALVTPGDVIKSPADDRDYRYLTLDNGLKVLLISDADTDKSAAAVDVNVGSYQDPDDRLGLAHFLEHMLFMGTEKYPDVDGYSEFIRANGGGSNAYTADVRTNYYFDINSDQFQPAMDRLAQFFIAPKLDPEYVEREKNAVDSEYRLHAREDGWRLFMATNKTSNPEHPKSRFNIGSLDTLNNDDGQLWQSLKDFHEKYYVASNMSVVVYGKESLDTLEQWVNASFSEVPSGTHPELKIGKAPYSDDEVQVRINIVPLKDTRVLSLSFPLPSTQEYYQLKPLGYLARVVGYEGKGSLHSYLKDRGWIDSLASYGSDLPGEYSEFNIRMELTPEGLKKVDDITAIVFDYLDLIRQEGMQASLYQESKQVAELGFRFQEDRNPQQTVSGLASRMHYLPAEHLLEANYIYEAYDPELILSYLNKMTPENLRQVVIAQGLPTDKVEPYFETAYSIEKLPAALVKRLRTPEVDRELTIPEPNPFIADNLDLVEGSRIGNPKVILEKSGLRLWNLTDTSFGMPRGNIRVMISSEEASKTPAENVMVQLYKALLSRSLNEYGYPAKEAGLNYSITAGRRGVMISLSGYSDKQPLLLEDILEAVKTFNPQENAFEQEKAVLLRSLKNKQFHTPYRLGLDALSQLAYPSYPDDATLLKAAEKVTWKQLQQYANAFYQHIHVEMLVLGNHSEASALQMGAMVERYLLSDTNRSDRFDLPYHLLGDTDRVVTMDIEHDDSMLISYYQLPETGNRERAQYALLGRLLANPFFNVLRTEQQLGYVVFAGPRPFEKHPGIIFVVQSPKLDPTGLEGRVEQFLQSQKAAFASLTNEELEQYRQGLIGDLLKKDDNQDERNNRFWQGIASGETDFDNRERIAEAVRQLTPADMQAALDRLLENKGKLVVRSFGEPHKSAYQAEGSRMECTSMDCFSDLPLQH
ncbi:insulinase family protein [uncultured Endozoicomonas sp.]|uniref:insulinase family protein n=1 Tax=uncultured Endozoicomonas sp. TaxID=432652 RepID=UPI002626AC43|nr:insulinase family protein [uncultured Endozoicomonas sp.]